MHQDLLLVCENLVHMVRALFIKLSDNLWGRSGPAKYCLVLFLFSPKNAV